MGGKPFTPKAAAQDERKENAHRISRISMCDRMNSRQLIVLPRSGAGAISCRFRRLATVWRLTSCPRLLSAPAIRRYPQLRFSRAKCNTKSSEEFLIYRAGDISQ